MNLINNFLNKISTTERSISESDINSNMLSTGSGLLSFGGYGTNYKANKALKLSTVNRCVNLISDSVASLPLIPYSTKLSAGDWKEKDKNNPLYNLLNIQPNYLTGRFMFFKNMVQDILLNGNSYTLIQRDKKGVIISLDRLNPDFVTVVIFKGLKSYKYNVNGKEYTDSEVIHLMNYSIDNVTGVSTIFFAANSLEISWNSEEHTKNFFLGGANLAGILTPKAGSSISDIKALKAKESFVNSLNNSYGGKSGSIVVLDSGLDYQACSVSPKDSQLLESRAFNVYDICRYFNVPPAMAFVENQKTSTNEQQSLSFLNDCLQAILEKIENEMFRKLYFKSEFNFSSLKFDVSNLFRLDSQAQADYFTKMFQVGGLTTNEIRQINNAENPVKGGNRAFIQVNMQPLDNLISEQVITTDTSKQIDNKLK